jgi:hypothetical protein
MPFGHVGLSWYCAMHFKSQLCGGDFKASRQGVGKSHVYRLTGDWVDPNSMLDAVEKKNYTRIFPVPGIETAYLSLYGSHRAVQIAYDRVSVYVMPSNYSA